MLTMMGEEMRNVDQPSHFFFLFDCERSKNLHTSSRFYRHIQANSPFKFTITTTVRIRTFSKDINVTFVLEYPSFILACCHSQNDQQ